jgi:hypothetical protein
MTENTPMLLSSINPRLSNAVRLDILEAATHVAGKAVQLLIGIWLQVIMKQSSTVTLSRRTMSKVNVSRYAATDALRRLEAADLIRVWRLPGRSPIVTLVEPNTSGKPLKVTADTTFSPTGRTQSKHTGSTRARRGIAGSREHPPSDPRRPRLSPVARLP